MAIEAVIGKRIEQLREAEGLTIAKLADILGITRQTMAKYLAGKQAISSDRLVVLARRFGKSLDWFLEPEESPSFTLMFRAEQVDGDVKEAFTMVRTDFERYALANELVGVKTAFVPSGYSVELEGAKGLSDGDKKEIERIAEKQRLLLGIDGPPGVDLFAALEDVGINVVAFSLEDDIFGMSAYAPKWGSFIYVNDALRIPEERKVFSLAHELGHLVLHRDRYVCSSEREVVYQSRRKDIAEKAADHFAGCLLMPRSRMERDFGFAKEIGLPHLLMHKEKYKVSVQALIMTLHNYGMLSPSKARALFSQLARRGYRKKEPNPMPYIEKNKRRLAIVQELYLADRITVGKIAELLGTTIVEARRLAKEWDCLADETTLL